MRQMTNFIIATALIAMSMPAANADIIVQYDAASSRVNPSLTASTAVGGITAVSLSAGAGLTDRSTADWNWGSWGAGNSNFDDAVADGSFFQWGFEVTGDVLVDLTTLDAQWDRSGSGPNTFEIRASVNGGSEVTVSTGDFSSATAMSGFSQLPRSFTDPISALGTLGLGDTVLFTLGAFGATDNSGVFALESALVINGTVTAVPEPTSWAGLIALGTVIHLRRRSVRARLSESS